MNTLALVIAILAICLIASIALFGGYAAEHLDEANEQQQADEKRFGPLK